MTAVYAFAAIVGWPFLLFFVSPRAGRWAGTHGPRPLMILGPIVGAAGALLLPLMPVSPHLGHDFTLTAFVVVILGGMGLKHDDYLYFRDTLEESGALSRTVMFVHTAADPVVECLLVPDVSLAVAEQFALEDRRVLVLLTDMTNFALRAVGATPSIALAVFGAAFVLLLMITRFASGRRRTASAGTEPAKRFAATTWSRCCVGGWPQPDSSAPGFASVPVARCCCWSGRPTRTGRLRIRAASSPSLVRINRPSEW